MPDDERFENQPKEVATEMPNDTFEPTEYAAQPIIIIFGGQAVIIICARPGGPSRRYTTKALQHSNVKLTWDADDSERVRILHRKCVRADLLGSGGGGGVRQRSLACAYS